MTLLADDAFATGDLAGIREAGCALAIRSRVMPDRLARALAGIDLAGVPPVLLGARRAHVRPALAQAFADAGYPAALADDAADLAQELAELLARETVVVRLEPVATDACRRFHADYMTVRLLVTYLGPGTQWHRADDPAEIRAIAAGDVALFKGRLLLDPPAILHRSPPISGTGQRRLLLVIDLPDSAS